MRKLILIALLALTVGAQAQEVKWANILRFSASLSSTKNPLVLTNPSLKNSQTDTSDWVPLVSPAANDTLMEAVFYSNVDSTKLTFKAQFGLQNLVLATTQIDSVCKGIPGTSYNINAIGQRLWHRRSAGADKVRFIITTASSGNHGGYLATPTKTYRVGLVTRKSK